MFKLFKKKQPTGTQIKLKISGMHCASCSMNIDGTLEDLPGVIKSETSYARAVTSVEYDQEQIDPSKIMQAINQLGYDVQLID